MFVLSELRQVILQGRLFELVTPLLDGRPVEAVCQELAGMVKPAQVFYTINSLEKKGYLCEADGAAKVANPALWTIQDITPADAANRLASTTVTVTGLGVDVAPLCSLLEELDVRVGASGGLDVVLTEHYLHRDLPAVNQRALESGRPWMLVKPLGLIAWIGPVFQPGKSACWECLAQRIRANFPVLGYLDSFAAGPGVPASNEAQTPVTLRTALGLAATTIANWISRAGNLAHLDGKLQTVNLLTLQSESHPVIRQPACSACGESGRGHEHSPLTLQKRRKTYTADGGHRSASPQETLDTYGHHISPISGAVTMLERMSSNDGGVMHVYISGNNIARGPESLFNLKVDLRNMSCGKGIDGVQAKASALCEGLERYSGIYRGDEPSRVASFVDLGDEAIEPNACMRFSDRQYAERDQRNAVASVYNFIPQPFDPDAEIEWTPTWSLTHNTARYLPMGLCYFNYPQGFDHHYCSGCSNGNAAGNSIEEAILQGFLELVERDAVGIWWYNRVQVPGIDLDSFEEPYLDRLRAFLKTRHRDLWALDMTSDLGIPAFAALSHRTDTPHEHIMFGFGAHLDPRIALLRSITELNQMVVPLLDVPPEGPIPQLNDVETVRWVQTATLAEQPYLVPRDEPLRKASDYAHSWTDDLYEDIEICRAAVESQGMEVLVLDQTRPEIKMPVVKVLVPGLRHFWMRFAPGRLYDVPVKLGWLNEPRTEDNLNPIPMFL